MSKYRWFVQVCVVALALASVAAARADIFQWEYVNPGNPGLGKQQSATLAPDGAGQVAAPFNYVGGNLTKAYLIGADLTGGSVSQSNLTDADLSHATLITTSFYFTNLTNANFSLAQATNADFSYAALVGANLTGADVRGANFQRDAGNAIGSGISLVQLYSTANYQAQDLTGIRLGGNILTGANLAGQNLTNASFEGATLTGVNLTNAVVRGANFSTSLGAGITAAQLASTADYQSHDLSGIGLGGGSLNSADLSGQNLSRANFSSASLVSANLSQSNLENGSFYGATLTGANLSQSNLTNASLGGATLTNANFAGALVQGARFGGTSFTAAQLYSTVSYQAHDLKGISFATQGFPTPAFVLNGWNLVGQNMAGADFYYAALVNSNLSQANLEGASFVRATLDNVNLSQANLRNANFDPSFVGSFGANVNVSGADVRGATINLTNAQLYSTASYQAHDLTGMYLGTSPGTNFVGQNLTETWLPGNLTNANFSQAILTNAQLSRLVAGANFTGAEIRGADFSIDPFYVNEGLSLAQLYATASYQAHDLTGVKLNHINLGSGNFVGQNLTNASFLGAFLTNANFTDADVRGAIFNGASGFTLAQLYASASYQAHDLTGIALAVMDLTGANFAGQNLTNAYLGSATLVGADFTGAVIRGVNFQQSSGPGGVSISLPQLYSTASYQAHDLRDIEFFGADLTGADFTGQNLTGTSFNGTILIGSNFSGAIIRGARLSFTTQEVQGFTASKLYSTASYQARDLVGVDLGGGNDLTGWNFAGQNLTESHFGGAMLNDAVFAGANLANAWLDQTFLTNADFSHANLSGALFYSATTLGGTNFSHANLQNADVSFYYENYYSNPLNATGADTRGAFGVSFYYYPAADFIVTNFIRPDGHIAGLNLNGGQLLIVRDHDGDSSDPFGTPIPPIPIAVDEEMAMGPGGVLRMVFESDAWDSTISFAAGIPVTRGGTLELTLADGVVASGEIGRTFALFDWTGVSPTGAFSVASPYWWDLSQLYTTGDVTLLPDADFSGNGVVDADDLAAWKMHAGLATGATNAQGDADYDGDVDGGDLMAWQRLLGASFQSSPPAGSVPEPAALVLVAAGTAWAGALRRRHV